MCNNFGVDVGQSHELWRVPRAPHGAGAAKLLIGRESQSNNYGALR